MRQRARSVTEAVPLPALDRLKEVVSYNPDTGVFTWKKIPGRRVKAGKIAGSKHKDGSVTITIDQRKYRAGRLAWLFFYGVEPEHEVDHKDGDNTNNRIKNLRDVPHQVNLQNQRQAQAGSKTGVLGVYRHHRGVKFVAQIKEPGGRRRHIGIFQTEVEASEAYVKAKREMHQGNTL